jgi:hypothetical protein
MTKHNFSPSTKFYREDGAIVSQEEAFGADGFLKPGYFHDEMFKDGQRMRFPVMMKDSAPAGNRTFINDGTSINDTITQLPGHLQAKALYLFADLKSSNASVRDDAIRNAIPFMHQLKDAAAITTDAAPLLTKVADALQAFIDAASNDSGIHDSATAYEKMRERDSKGWEK